VAAARGNGEANGLAARLDHRQGGVEVVAGSAFDLIVANIGGELLLDEAPRVAGLVRPGGRLILSGLLASWGEPLEAAYQARGLSVLDRRNPESFCLLFMQRPRSPGRQPVDAPSSPA
jgi:ribosomal protein L11 methyltransferase